MLCNQFRGEWIIAHSMGFQSRLIGSGCQNKFMLVLVLSLIHIFYKKCRNWTGDILQMVNWVFTKLSGKKYYTKKNKPSKFQTHFMHIFDKSTIVTYNQFAFISKSMMWVFVIFGGKKPQDTVNNPTKFLKNLVFNFWEKWHRYLQHSCCRSYRSPVCCRSQTSMENFQNNFFVINKAIHHDMQTYYTNQKFNFQHCFHFSFYPNCKPLFQGIVHDFSMILHTFWW